MTMTSEEKDYVSSLVRVLAYEAVSKINTLPVDLRILVPSIEVRMIKVWGYWDAHLKKIVLSQKLVFEYSFFFIRGVFLHELAHAIVTNSNAVCGQHAEPLHGKRFMEVCAQLGVPNEFRCAAVDLEGYPLELRHRKQEDATQKLMQKVEKLLALAQSSNEHEAALAISKVQLMYAKLNQEQASFLKKSDLVSCVIMKSISRVTQMDLSIVDILKEYFFVDVLISYNLRFGYASRMPEFIFFGTQENVLMAEYVYYFLSQEMERCIARSSIFLRGLKEHNDYRLGVLNGFKEQLKEQKKQFVQNAPSMHQKALVPVFYHSLAAIEYIQELYGDIRSSTSRSSCVNPETYRAGSQEGKKLQLHKPMTHAQGNTGKFLR